MRRVIPLIGVCLLFAAAAQSAFAQQRLFARTQTEVVELDPRASSLGTVIRRFPLPQGSFDLPNNDVVSFLGGEFLVWTAIAPANRVVVLMHTHTGAIQQFAFPDFQPQQVIGTDGNARLVVRGHNASGGDVVLVADARSGSVRFLNVSPQLLSVQLPQIAYASASDILFAPKPSGPDVPSYHHIDVIQASTGAVLKTLDISPLSAGAMSTNAAGTRLYAGGAGFDVVTGKQFAGRTSERVAGTMTLDEHRNRFLAHFTIGPSAAPETQELRGIASLSADSLQFLGRVQLPLLPLPEPTARIAPRWAEAFDFSGLSATMFVLQAVEVQIKNRAATCHESQLIALDADTGSVRRTVSTTDALGLAACNVDLVRITEPAPPPGLNAEVAAHKLTLTWQAPFGATHYEIEAGTAPGLANLATIQVHEPQLVVDGVPSGLYFLRVRAINTIGKSSASQDVQVIVP